MTLRLAGSTSGYVEIDSQAVGGNNTMLLPTSNGSANQFLKNGSTAGTLGWSSMIENASGQIGIGTASPSYTVHMSSISAADVYIGQTNSLATSVFGTGNGGGTFVYNSAAYPIQFFTNATERMRIRSDGRVNIPDSAPVVGTLNVKGADIQQIGFQPSGTTGFYHQMGSWNTGTGNFAIVHSSGTGVQLIGSAASSWSGFSDVRLKNVTGTITDALTKIKQLEPITFTWKKDQSAKPCVGISAQSIQPVLPEAIDECPDFGNPDDDTKYLSVRYTDLVPLLTAALQEAMERIETLESANASLEARLTALEAAQ